MSVIGPDANSKHAMLMNGVSVEISQRQSVDLNLPTAPYDYIDLRLLSNGLLVSRRQQNAA